MSIPSDYTWVRLLPLSIQDTFRAKNLSVKDFAKYVAVIPITLSSTEENIRSLVQLREQFADSLKKKGPEYTVGGESLSELDCRISMLKDELSRISLGMLGK